MLVVAVVYLSGIVSILLVCCICIPYNTLTGMGVFLIIGFCAAVVVVADIISAHIYSLSKDLHVHMGGRRSSSNSNRSSSLLSTMCCS
jgi:Na+-transporting NADH:ubiquinone oxidoreductase subunit NqrD